MEQLDLFVGSEGTLGIVSEIELALLPAMKQTFDLVAFFPTEELAVDFVAAAKAAKEPTINFFEFFDENTLQLLRPDYPKIPANAKAAIYIEQENPELDFWSPLLERYQSSLDQSWLGLGLSQKEELAKFRHAIPEKINDLFKQHHQIKLATDIAVPESRFKEMFNFYDEKLKAQNEKIFYIKFGHISDNHLHVNLIAREKEDFSLAQNIVSEFVTKAVALGGTISAEHGIGKIKKPYLRTMLGSQGIEKMLEAKKHFDPGLILGRDTLFDA
jgi:D-lactate dehydrogenase (cytochrome)